MIRIVREENPNRLDERSKSTLALLGVAISSNPKLFKQLLDIYGIQVPTSDKISLANGIIEGLAQQSKSFLRNRYFWGKSTQKKKRNQSRIYSE